MERLGFVHLSGPQRGQEAALHRLPATIGSDPGSDLVIPGIAPRHAVVFRRDSDIVLQDGGSPLGTYFLGTEVHEVVLRDGDVVELGLDGPVLRFLRQREEPSSRPGRSRMSETMAFRLVHQTSRAFRSTVVVVLVVAGGLLGWSYMQSRRLQGDLATLRQAMNRAEEERRVLETRVEEERRRAAAEREVLQHRLEEYRSREESLRTQVADAATGEVESLKGALEATRLRIKTLESERAAGETIIRQYGSGVCLIQGSYAFHDAEGRPLRVRLEESGRPAKEADGSTAFSVDAEGPVHTIEYYGTGFLVDRRGIVLTNRHLADPWWNDDEAERLQRDGYRPRMLRLRGFFPQQKEPFDLKPDRHAEGVDLALLRIDVKGRRIPVLPLDRSRQGAVAGQPVVVVGYPAGLEAILAKAEAGVVRQILESHGTNSERVTEALSSKGLIRPSTTQGHIGDVTKTDIVFDAPTTQGGSGGPVFNKHGEVVAVEYAVLSQFGGNSFGIPISYALELLEPKSPKKK